MVRDPKKFRILAYQETAQSGMRGSAYHTEAWLPLKKMPRIQLANKHSARHKLKTQALDLDKVNDQGEAGPATQLAVTQVQIAHQG